MCGNNVCVWEGGGDCVGRFSCHKLHSHTHTTSEDSPVGKTIEEPSQTEDWLACEVGCLQGGEGGEGRGGEGREGGNEVQ